MNHRDTDQQLHKSPNNMLCYQIPACGEFTVSVDYSDVAENSARSDTT